MNNERMRKELISQPRRHIAMFLRMLWDSDYFRRPFALHAGSERARILKELVAGSILHGVRLIERQGIVHVMRGDDR